MKQYNLYLGYFFVFLIVIFSISCKREDEISRQNRYSGTRGLDIRFMDQSIPDRLFENDNFELILKLTNFGASPITTGESVLKLYLEGDYMEFSDNTNVHTENIELAGKERFTSRDDFVVKQYSVDVKQLDEQSQTQDVEIFAIACFNYKTKAYADVCIDTDIYNTKPIEKACSAAPVDLSGGQGAPVAVTKVESRMLTSENDIHPQFKIYISNAGLGSVIEHNSYSTICSQNTPDRENYNTVELSQLGFSQYTISDFDCSPGNKVVKLEHGQDYILCTLNQGISKSIVSYETPLYIELSYGYTVKDTLKVNINKLST